ncbi:MAG: hypothetical protein ACYS8Z_20810 [Planctomycetota bacterium]|jgi:hypothetical protein
MKKRLKHKTVLAICVLILFLVCITLAFRWINNTLRPFQTWGFVGSTNTFLCASERPEVVLIRQALDENWRPLTEEEYAHLAKAASETRVIDRNGLSDERDKVMLDGWDRRVLIWGRIADRNEPEFIVISKGRDGLLGTSDDIGSPAGAIPPAVE